MKTLFDFNPSEFELISLFGRVVSYEEYLLFLSCQDKAVFDMCRLMQLRKQTLFAFKLASMITDFSLAKQVFMQSAESI